MFQINTNENKAHAASGESWEYKVNEDNSLTITKYTGNQTIVSVPASIEGKIVTRIEGYEYTSIKEITFPSTIEFIDKSIFFRGLIEMINVDTNNNHYKSVDGALFSGNMEKLIAYPMGNSRSTYRIPEEVKIIAFNAFATTIYNGTTALKNVEVPRSVTSIEDIHSLGARTANINVDPDNQTYKSIDGVLFNKSGDKLICYPYGNTRSEYSVPEGTKTIAYQGFYGTYATEHFLTTLRLPASLESFPMLFEIEKIENIEVNPNNPYLTSIEGVLFSKDLKTLISYPMGNSRLSYTIPAGVAVVEYGAFYDIYQYPHHPLINLTIPASLVDFGNLLSKGWENIFVEENHPDLKSVSGVLFSKDGKTLIKYPREKKMKSYSIPTGTESMNSSAFFSCNYLEKLIVPDSVRIIEQESISWCERLADVAIYNSSIDIRGTNFLGRNVIKFWGTEGSTTRAYTQANNLAFGLLGDFENADLSSLTLSNGSIDPVFTSETTVYSAGVVNDISRLTVTATAYYANSIVSINEVTMPDTVDGVYSRIVNLNVGMNSIPVEVTAKDGITKKTYMFNILRLSAPVSTDGKGDGGNPVGGGGFSGIPGISEAPDKVVEQSPTPAPPQTSPSSEVVLDSNSLIIEKKIGDNGKTTTNVKPDPVKLLNAIKSAQAGADKFNKADSTVGSIPTIIIPLKDNSDNASVQIPASLFMEAKVQAPTALIVIQTNLASYSLPVQLFSSQMFNEYFGNYVDINDFKINITIEKITDSLGSQIKSKMAMEGYRALSDSLNFTLTMESDGQIKEIVDLYGKYVVRSLILPLNSNVNTLSALVYDPLKNETSFVPAVARMENDQTIVEIKSPHNSIYTIVEGSKTFNDVIYHWAKKDIEILASKKIILGVSEQSFIPEKKITRAEFTAILVRALGLTIEQPITSFSDVKTSDWFASSVAAAVRTNLVTGYSNYTFTPNGTITRQEMAVMLARAIKYAGGIPTSTSSSQQLPAIKNFEDGLKISSWASKDIEQLVSYGIITGVTNSQFEPSSPVTRAQVVTALTRMLQQLKFIN